MLRYAIFAHYAMYYTAEFFYDTATERYDDLICFRAFTMLIFADTLCRLPLPPRRCRAAVSAMYACGILFSLLFSPLQLLRC